MGSAGLEDVEHRMLVDLQKWGRKTEAQRHAPMHMDAKLRLSRRAYVQFVKDLQVAGVLTYTRSPRSRVPVFRVAKKDGKLWLVVHCRAANELLGGTEEV